MNRNIRFFLTIALAAVIAAGSALQAQAREVRSSGRTNVNQNKNVNRNTNVNRNNNVNVNSNRNRNVNIDRDIDVDVDVHHRGSYYGGCCYHDNYHPIATAAAVTATAIVVGSMVRTLPPSCTTVVVNGFAYRQCGSTWYQPQISGSSTTYIVVNSPR